MRRGRLAAGVATWGRGYATEAAQAALAFGFDELDLDEIVSFTTVANERSRRVMEKLGMTHDPADDFDHPSAAPWRRRRHVLYRLGRPSRLMGAAQHAGGDVPCAAWTANGRSCCCSTGRT